PHSDLRLGDVVEPHRNPGGAQGRALPEDGLVQAARDAERARAPFRRGETAGGDHNLGRERGPVARLLLGHGSDRLPGRHGGGGLISGIATAVKGARPDVRIVGVEPELSPAMHAALEVGEPVTVQPTSIADGLNAPFAGENTLAICRELVDEVVLVTEDELKDAFRFLYGRAKLAVEPAGAACAAALLAGKVSLTPGETVVAVVSGGNVATRTAVAILDEE